MTASLIKSVRCLQLRLPFDHGAPPPLFAGTPRNTLDSGLVRVELADGTVGWGESYGADLDALSSIFRNRVAPLAVGRDALDANLMTSMHRALHLMGRSGPVVHALSGLDIALWDIRGKLEGVPVHALLGGARRTRIATYASLLQYYDDAALIQRNVSRALEAGHREVKLHEKTTAAVAAARNTMGAALPLMVDVNCAWSPRAAAAAVRDMAPLAPLWVEEPVWPPEDTAALATLRRQTGTAIAAGENASSAAQLAGMIADREVDYVQPSAIKLGGLTPLWQIAQLCAGSTVKLAPHCTCFGPGLLATLHVLAAHAHEVTAERLFCDLGFTPYAGAMPLRKGAYELTDRPGLGADPEPEFINGPYVRE